MATPVVRLDRSRPYSTVHGERSASDRHANVFFYQDKLPFGADGTVLANHPDIAESPELAALLEGKLKKAAKVALSAPGDDAADGLPTAPVEADEGPEEVNLTLWARGEQQVQWQHVTDAIARRYGRRVKDKAGALELLIGEGAVQLEHLPAPHRKLVA